MPLRFTLGKIAKRLVRANQERGPFNAYDLLPIHIFSFTSNCLQTFSSIGQQGIRQIVFFLVLALGLGVSREMPSTTAPAFCSFFEGVAGNPQASIVQPGVSALG